MRSPVAAPNSPMRFMAAAGTQAEEILQQALKRGDYILIIEGAIPTKKGYGMIARRQMIDIGREFAGKAKAIIAVGSCATWGGVPAGNPNPAGLQGVRPWRAQRLESGNTLITDYQRGQVVEVDPESKQVWKKTGLSRPVQAIRLEEGNILILEQGANRLIEVDPATNKSVDVVKGLNYPQGMSTY